MSWADKMLCAEADREANLPAYRERAFQKFAGAAAVGDLPSGFMTDVAVSLAAPLGCDDAHIVGWQAWSLPGKVFPRAGVFAKIISSWRNPQTGEVTIKLHNENGEIVVRGLDARIIVERIAAA